MILECCPDYSVQNGTCQACIAGRYGKNCQLPCLPNYHGVQCKQHCNCAYNKKCDPVQGCVFNEGFNEQNANITNECHQKFYNISYNFNCSDTCYCRNDTFCNPRSGVCECSDETLCKNITKKSTPKKHTDTQSVPFITVVNFSAVGIPMLLFTCFLLIKQCKLQYQHRPRDSETISDQTYQNGIYCEINDDQLKDQTRINSSGTGNYNSEKNCQQTTEENHRHIYIAKSLPNLCMYEEQYLSPYCSLQHADNDYLNPYCALGLERRVSSCSNLFTLTNTIDESSKILDGTTDHISLQHRTLSIIKTALIYMIFLLVVIHAQQENMGDIVLCHVPYILA
ncbi:multiple epidermal growth factor-like domains protein 11 [Mytilus californianus]|uniref:multiple epidermal growth factor-like domains protein 11 n=1 Tax=Mytilus californianus TaxID=6549 RepID=UPI00224533FB|nr:multiple epidermal growth factor-like domains protein 11 [Mytilus californianus]